MGFFYRVSAKDFLEIRNNIFLEKGVPMLKKNGFVMSPFSTSYYGRNNLKDFTYNLCRLTLNSRLEIITTHIVRGEKWIQIYLNIFELNPFLESIESLKSLKGIQFSLPPNSISEMRLRSDDYKGPPIFSVLFCKQHKLETYLTKNGLNNRINQLGELIESDMNNINWFVNKWYELHNPTKTTWEGDKI